MDEKTRLFIEAAQRCVKATRKFNKVFCIGAHKTGTTSMQAVFQTIGLRVAPQHEGELYSLQAGRGVFSGLSEYVNQYDAFQDSPFANKFVFANLDALYPDSRFILTVREPEEWFNSLTRFHAKIFGVESVTHVTQDMLERASYLYPGYIAESTAMLFLNSDPDYRVMPANRTQVTSWHHLYDKDLYINGYNARNEMIRAYFREQDHKLLEIDITKESDTGKIVEFLGLPSWLTIPMPRMNET